MKSAKIIVTGPVRAGTTSFIRSLSEIAVLSTERKLGNGSSQNGRGEATVALDFGRITISRELVLYLFGTPGEEPDTLACGPLAEGPIGVIVVVDATRPASVEGAAEILEFLLENSDVPLAVAANRMPQDDEGRVSKLREDLRLPAEVPVVACEATQRVSAKRVVLALLDRIIDTTPATAGANMEAE